MFRFVVKWVFAFALLTVTYNPGMWSYGAWLANGHDGRTSLAVLLGLLLLVAYVLSLRAALRAVGLAGLATVAACLGALGWVLADLEMLPRNDHAALAWLGLVGLSAGLAVAMAWDDLRLAFLPPGRSRSRSHDE
ncbi:MAG: hypothetical protein JJU40_00530 [Rhodobacteraceae bacterium]|nr:hypothetical protein [Paracoccaceae bacterium]